MNILAVDDELVSRKKLEQLIQGLNHEVLVASDGDEAWEIWESRRPRLVITEKNASIPSNGLVNIAHG